MPQGLTQFRYHGGPFDGTIYDNQPTIHAGSVMHHIFSVYAAWDSANENVSICKTLTGKFGKRWFAHAKAEYRKREPAKGGVDYDFVRCIVVGRCMAITKKGEQCRNAAQEGSTLCEGSHRSASKNLVLLTDEFLLDELHHIAETGAPDVLGHLERAEELKQ